MNNKIIALFFMSIFSVAMYVNATPVPVAAADPQYYRGFVGHVHPIGFGGGYGGYGHRGFGGYGGYGGFGGGYGGYRGGYYYG
ncbi:keratin-associated protein 19-5-like isoform X2 [Euwallacea fornicatus]|uniref:keratin-associated protein 19-5-like isoform X2 n=1 Tax=Euwallacea fornicatus TaxID=995702 RepID=UPI0033904602